MPRNKLGWLLTFSALGVAELLIPAAAADVFDALVTERPYKRAWSTNEALAELQRAAGTHFDPTVITAIRAVLGLGAGAVDQEPAARAA